MVNNDQSTLLLYCCEDVKSHRSGGDTVPFNDYMAMFSAGCVTIQVRAGMKSRAETMKAWNGATFRFL